MTSESENLSFIAGFDHFYRAHHHHDCKGVVLRTFHSLCFLFSSLLQGLMGHAWSDWAGWEVKVRVSACATVSVSSLRDPEARDIPVVLALCGVRIRWDLVYRMWSVGIRYIQILMSFRLANSKSFTVMLGLCHALSLLFFSRLTIFLPLLPSLCCCR